jgi:hypothetical protein
VSKSADEAVSVYTDLRRRLAAIPGVIGVSMSEGALIGDGRSASTVLPVESDATDSVSVLGVGPGFLSTMQMPLVHGREIGEMDTRPGARPVVMVNESYARKFFGDADPSGRLLKAPRDSARIAALRFEVVGVARDMRYGRMVGDYPPVVFVPFSHFFFGDVRQLVFALRTSGDAASYERQVRQVVRDISPRMPVTRVATQVDLIGRLIAAPILLARLCATFALLALTIALVGLYGSVSYDVSRRMPEIGVRMALGARRGQIVRLVLGRVFVLAALGVALGVPAALYASTFARAYLFGVTSSDPVTIVAATGALLAAALMAAYAPARAAARLNPTLALRRD